MFIAQIEEIVKQVNAASDKSDRWLFLFVLVVLALCGSIVIRVLYGMWKESEARFNEYQKSDRTKSIEMYAQLNSVLEDANQIQKDSNDALKRYQLLLEDRKSG